MSAMAKRRVLVVDDSQVVHEVARLALETVGGWEVLTAGSGAEAVEVAGAARPDAVLVDVVMPDMDGPATVRALRADTATHGVPVVFLTAQDDPAERERLAAMDVSGVLSKPFQVTSLAADLAALLGWDP
jgi:CheY-like chemotaxis protein